MKYFLSQKGPIIGAITIYKDLLAYKNGIYETTDKSNNLGEHAIKIYGYGYDQSSQKKYFMAQNTWGK